MYIYKIYYVMYICIYIYMYIYYAPLLWRTRDALPVSCPRDGSWTPFKSVAKSGGFCATETCSVSSQIYQMLKTCTRQCVGVSSVSV